MTRDDVLKKWSDVLVLDGDKIKVTGAVRIGEPAQIRRDLEAAGYKGSGRPTTYNNGEHFHHTYKPGLDPLQFQSTARREHGRRGQS